ncbi:MAG TPA: endonuclease/exonuclease/phosphatase family protein [Geminicoccaceae bacterium]|jgi:endonuclease/exonuclease/phosphatase family metal-dependent hydrolase|nr:endonuclease/exonuclease/phosphatase family protein [Geminicoccaceae bacterium]
MANIRDISLATFNLYNLQLPGESWRGTPYTEPEYALKIAWSAQALRLLDADVVVFQELWSPQCLRDVFRAAQLDGDYDLVFLREEGWYDIAVALAVRRPWTVRARQNHKAFPDGFVLKKRAVTQAGNEDPDDDIEVLIDEFSRTVIQASIAHERAQDLPAIELFATHLKSKLPTRLDAEEGARPEVRGHSQALGAALSTIRRTAEAAALRTILNDVMRDTDVPVAVVGDFNDSPNSNTLAILTEQPSFRFYADSRAGRTTDRGLYVAGALQQLRSFRDVNYTHVYKGEHDSLDHVLVSEQFYDHSDKHLWTFREMRCWNDHLAEQHDPGATDHGLVRARFDYNRAG